MGIPDIPILATAISLVICWSLFAILCSFIHETAARTKSERGRFFREKLIQQLRDRANDINWGYLMYTHGNMDLLSQKSNAPAAEISPKIMAQTFMNVVSNAAIVNRHMPDKPLSDNVSPSTNNERVLEAFHTATSKLKQSDVVQMMQVSLQQANSKALHPANFSALTDHASIDKKFVSDELEKQLTLWFEQFCDQCSNWYNIITRKRLFYLGVLLAVLLNVDSIGLFRYFLAQPNARAQVIGFYQQNADKLERLQQAITDTTGQPIDTVLLKEIRTEVKTLTKTAALPVGFNSWKEEPVITRKTSKNESISMMSTEWFSLLILKMIGLILSGFAASIGAPFWFDLLKKVYNKKA